MRRTSKNAVLAAYPKPAHKSQRPKIQKIILQSSKVCYVTGRTDGLQEHHCLYGKNRQKADDYGLTVWLRPEWHTGEYGVHHGNIKLDIELKQLAQTEFEKVYGHLSWMAEFGLDYCD
jgi:hypothetical protein